MLRTLLSRLPLAVTLASLSLGCADDNRNPVQSGVEKPPPAVRCQTPSAGCPCSDEGATVKCGETVSRKGDTVECREGQRTCTGGQWGECIGGSTTKVYSPAEGPGLRAKGLADSSSDCSPETPCDPFCQEVADTPDGLDAGSDFTVDPEGVTLFTPGYSGGNCPDIVVTPKTQTLVVTKINPDGTVVPNELIFEARCHTNGPLISPTWSANNPDRASISTTGVLSVYSGIAGNVGITAKNVLDSDSATATVRVIINERDPGITDADETLFQQAGTSADPGKTLYPYKETVFPLDLKAPLVQWETGGSGATQVQVALRYPLNSGNPSFWYAKIFNGEPKQGTLAPNEPAWQIPQEVWTAFSRSAAGSAAEIIIQRKTGNTLRREMIIPIRFATAALRGSVYYTQYLRRLFEPGSAVVCSGQNDLNPNTYTPGDVCPVGNCTHPRVPGGSMTRAIDLSKPTAPNNDPFNGANGCPVCHTVSAQGNVYVAGSRFLQIEGTPPGTSTGFVASIGLDAAGSPTFTTLGEAPNYSTLPGATDWDSRGFAFAALTPDGAYAIQGPYWWGNTRDGALGTGTVDGAYKVNNVTRPMFVVPTTNTGTWVHYATTAALSPASAALSGNTLQAASSGTIANIDGVAVQVGDSILVKDETDKKKNGIYTLNSRGSGTSKWSMTRRSDMDQTGEIKANMDVRVIGGGNANYAKVFYLSSPASNPSINGASTSAMTFTDRGADRLPVMMTPNFSPNGKKLVYVNGDADPIGADTTEWRRGLTMVDFDQATRKIANKKRLINNKNSDIPLKWPFFENDSRSLLVVQTSSNEYCTSASSLSTDPNKACFESIYGHNSPTTRGYWPGRIFSLDTNAATPSSTLTELSRLNDAEDPSDADKAYQPTVLPFVSGGYRWVIFTSPRAYGNQFNQKGTHFTCGASTLWVAAIANRTAAANDDRSYPAFLLPGQNMAPITQQDHYVNERGYLVPSPCKGVGVSCSTSDECCGTNECRVTSVPASGPPVRQCSVPTACSAAGGSCVTDADCCGSSPCLDNVCQTPVTYASPATFVRDFVAECPYQYHPRWGLFSFHLTTPESSHLAFSAQTAADFDELESATKIALVDSNQDNYGQDPQTVDVGAKLTAAGKPNSFPYLRISMTFYPSGDGLFAPILHDWEQRYTCVPAE
jgi:hypothetical protein